MGLLALTVYVLSLLAFNPKLAESQLFDALATAIVVSGLIGSVVAYLFGSSKGSDDKTALLAQRGAPSPSEQPAPPATKPVEPAAQ